MYWKQITAVAALSVAANAVHAEEIRIGIGHQSMCTDTYTAGIIVKELNLIEKHLPKDGKYKNAKFVFDWKDYTSGPPITNMMLANKLDFGVMGDYPLIVNGAKFQETNAMRSMYVAGTGYNLHGSGNAIVVPTDSDVYSFADLKGKSLSVPVGSAAWGMVLKAMQDNNMSEASLDIKNQSPPVGAANIAKNKIDAHADFCPWSEVMEYRGTGRKIFDGGDAGVPYLHGVVVRKDYAEKYPEVVVAFIKAIIDAGEWVKKDPVLAAESLEKWTGIEKEVQYLYFSKGGHLTLDPTIKSSWVEALTYDHGILAKEKAIPPLDMKEWINDSFVREAYKEMKLDYDQALASVTTPKEQTAGLPPAEVWHAKDGIQSFDSTAAMLKTVNEYINTGQKVNAVYVYDNPSGLKLFAKVAFFVKDDKGNFASFMKKPDADAYASSVKGRVLGFDDAVSLFDPVEVSLQQSTPTSTKTL